MNLLFSLTEDGSYVFTTAGYAVLIVAMLALLLLGCFLTRNRAKISAKQLAFSAVAIALAMVTSMIKLIHMPYGGSVTLFSMLFICLIGYWYGLGTGLTTAIAYGILQMLIDPYIISLPQMLIDYIFAFGALGLSGLFTKKPNGLIKGYIVGVFGRFVFSVLSGVVFFGMYAPDSFPNPFIYSVAYNGSYLGLEAFITVIALLIPAVSNGLTQVYKLTEQA